MTNADYIKSRLSDRDLCDLFVKRSMFYDDGFLSEINKVHRYWSSLEFTSTGNVKKLCDKTHSIWEWRKTFDEESNEWKDTGRTQEVTFQVWLFEKYDEKYWNEAIDMYKERYKTR